jgi:uncharacterized protein GlcG (DUF336 family)
MFSLKSIGVFALGASLAAVPMLAQNGGGALNPRSACRGLPGHAALKAALESAVVVGDSSANGGLANDMWGTVVNRDGVVCAVVFTGDDRGDQWPGSRVISAQKANTANAFSLPDGAGGIFVGLALSTANLYFPVQPGQSLFGLQFSNPVDPEVAYAGNPRNYGQPNDPMVGGRIGGVNVFGGGLGLYNANGDLIGALGVSGDTSCTDHNVAWKTRDSLELDNVPAGVGTPGDNIVYDLVVDPANGELQSGGFGHPECDAVARAIAEDFDTTHPNGPNGP